MRVPTRLKLVLVAVLVVVVVACAGSSTPAGGSGGATSDASAGSPGSEGSHCYPNGTCNSGFSCLSSLCVKLPSAAGGSPTGGATSTGGAVGTGGAASSTGGAVGTGGGSGGVGGSAGSGGAGGAASNCQAAANYGTITFTVQSAVRASDSSVFDWKGQLNSVAQPDLLVISLFQDKPPFVGIGTLITSVDLSTQSQFDSCGACVLVSTQTDSTGQGKQTYIATSGTLAISQASQISMAGTLSNVTFQHVNIDPVTFHSTKADDCVSALTSGTFNAPPTLK